MLADLRLGFSACWHEPRVRPLLLAAAVSALNGGAFSALYMLFTLNEIGLAPGAVGLIISVGGVAALCGALVSRRLTLAMGLGPAMIVCLAIGEAGGLLIPLAGELRWLAIPLLIGQQFIGDAFVVAYEIQAVSLRQAALPLVVLARANAVFAAVNGLLLPLGALLTGMAGSAFGLRPTLWVGIGIGLLAPLLLLPLRHLGRVPGDELEKTDGRR
jgi:predicted MFS family arabinose efflux permease